MYNMPVRAYIYICAQVKGDFIFHKTNVLIKNTLKHVTNVTLKTTLQNHPMCYFYYNFVTDLSLIHPFWKKQFTVFVND